MSDVPHREALRLDGRPLTSAYDATRRSATAAIDLKRATGFHLLQVAPDRRYLFGTEDAKLRIDGVVEMLAFLRTHAESLGLAWSGTLQFSGSSQQLRDVRLDVAWLEGHVAEIAALATAIAARPAALSVRQIERATSGIPHVVATAKLVRRRPELMERHPDGAVEFESERWSPREIVRQRREQTRDTPGNRTLTRLLVAVLELALACRSAAPSELKPAVAAHVDAIARCLRLEPFASLRKARRHLRVGAFPIREERTDERYRRARALLNELLRDRHWDPHNQVSDEWAFAALADRVYQAFAGIVIARAFDLAPAQPLGGSGPHFTSEDYELWVDATPPSEVLHNWRDDTSTPSALRPDLVLRRIADGEVALLDAKYRSAGARATSESLSEVQLYLQAFGALEASVLFPPMVAAEPVEPQLITNGRFGLTELPLRPQPDLGEFVREKLRPAIERTFHAPVGEPRQAAQAAEEERGANAAQVAAVRTLVADGEVVRLTQPNALLATENHLRRLLSAVWEDLPEDIQKMLLTAEYFGDQVPDGYDHSGPVLGLFAACEALIRTRLFLPADQAVAGAYRRVTFGEGALALKRLPKWNSGPEAQLRRWAARQPGTNIEQLGRCGKAMLGTNKWRIAAAHAYLVEKKTWDDTHTVILDRQRGLLVQLCAALPDP
ncbi:MAG: hypothetical protein ACRDPM_13625 [Solirubrobacteraceae bacterium]